MRDSELKLEIGRIRGCIEMKVYRGIGSVLSKHTKSRKYDTILNANCFSQGHMYVFFLTLTRPILICVV